jgi:hypothetical protein
LTDENALEAWARRFQTTCSAANLSGKLLTTLVPMLRVAIRSGVGQPAFVAWVNEQLKEFDPSERADTDRLADLLAPRLRDMLLSKLYPPTGHNTVVDE